jgi:hypothetical protein
MTSIKNQSLVQNCKFKFKCHKTWQSLEIKADYAENRRFCSHCSTDVYLANNEGELETAILNNYCVAIPVNCSIDFLSGSDAPPMTTLGILAPIEPKLTEQELSNLKNRTRLGRLIIFILIGLGIYFLAIKK